MFLMFFIIGVALWTVIGAAGFAWWWTWFGDFKIGNLFASLGIGLLLGPFTWLAGMSIHGDDRRRKLGKGKSRPLVLIKEREGRNGR
jgi:hypothetical protein